MPPSLGLVLGSFWGPPGSPLGPHWTPMDHTASRAFWGCGSMVECKRRRMLCLLGAVYHTSSVDDVLDDVVDGSKVTATAQPTPQTRH